MPSQFVLLQMGAGWCRNDTRRSVALSAILRRVDKAHSYGCLKPGSWAAKEGLTDVALWSAIDEMTDGVIDAEPLSYNQAVLMKAIRHAELIEVYDHD